MTPVIANPERYLNAGLVPLPPRLKLHPDAPFDQTETRDLSAAITSVQRGKHPIGFNVRPGVDYAKLLTQVQAMGGCRAMVFHEYSGNLRKLNPFLEWVDTLIWRPAEFVSERLYLDAPDPEQWAKDRANDLRAAGFNPMRVHVHLHNEAGWSEEMLDWEYAAIDWGLQFGWRYVAINAAVGTPELDQMPLASPIVSLAQRYPEQVMVGLHEYFSVFGNRKAPWYINRWSFWPDGVKFVIAEAGAEDIADDHPYTDTLPRTGDRQHVGPVHANDAAWQQEYGAAYHGKDAQYLAEIQTAWDVGKWGDARIAGVCLFSWGS